MEKRGQFLFIIILIFLISIAGFLGYLIYQNVPGKPMRPSTIFKEPKLEVGNLSYVVKQFYPYMKFNHNSISYKIDPVCSQEKREDMIEAFNELASEVGIISFYETTGETDISVGCSEEMKEEAGKIEKRFFIAGEGGAEEIIQTGKYNVITKGIVLLYDDSKGLNCGWPNIELHELLHVFGFQHSQDKNSLMYPVLESCNQKLDEGIVNDLKELYSQENLADLYFEKVTAVKRGRYLDFNITIKNSGVLDTKNVVLSVFDENDRIEDFNLNDIPLGAGVNFEVSNLKLKSRSSDNVFIVIDPDDLIKEIDEENGVAELDF